MPPLTENVIPKVLMQNVLHRTQIDDISYILNPESPRYCCNSVDMFRPLSITEFSRFIQVDISCRSIMRLLRMNVSTYHAISQLKL